MPSGVHCRLFRSFLGKCFLLVEHCIYWPAKYPRYWLVRLYYVLMSLKLVELLGYCSPLFTALLSFVKLLEALACVIKVTISFLQHN